MKKKKNMYKVMVHIVNDCITCDKDVSTIIYLPAFPRKYELLYLGREIMEILENKAKSNINIASAYADQWIKGYKYPLTKDQTDDLSFVDAFYIATVMYRPGLDIIHIELDDKVPNFFE